MKRINFFAGIPALLLFLCINSLWAATTDTWIFRSQVAPNQTMWGTSSTGYNYNNTYEASAPPFTAGFSWALQADPGIVSGNVQGNISATYDRVMQGLSGHSISLNYAGQENESQLSTNLGVQLSANPYIRFGGSVFNITADLGADMVDIGVNTQKDFTTGLNSTMKDTNRYNILPFNADIAIISGDLNFYLNNDVSFTPQTITGVMKYRHIDPVTFMADPLSEKSVDITFGQDNGLYDFAVDFDRPGMWEFTLEDFSLSDNTFNQQLGLGIEVGVGVPILSAEFKADIDLGLSFGGGEQELDFLNHGDDGDDETADILSRWMVMVNAVPTPVPTPFVLLGMGLIGLVGIKRKD